MEIPEDITAHTHTHRGREMYRERTTKSKEIGNEPGTERNAQLIKGRNRKDELAREGMRERSIERGNKRERETEKEQ